MSIKIDRSSLKENYTKGASANAEKLVKNFIATPGKVDAARSEAAEALYGEKVAAAVANKSRQKALSRVSESDVNAAMQATGAANYRSGTGRGADKQVRNVEPYLSALEGITLPARTSDPMTNVTGRVGLIAVTLSDLKKRLG